MTPKKRAKPAVQANLPGVEVEVPDTWPSACIRPPAFKHLHYTRCDYGCARCKVERLESVAKLNDEERVRWQNVATTYLWGLEQVMRHVLAQSTSDGADLRIAQFVQKVMYAGEPDLALLEILGKPEVSREDEKARMRVHLQIAREREARVGLGANPDLNEWSEWWG